MCPPVVAGLLGIGPGLPSWILPQDLQVLPQLPCLDIVVGIYPDPPTNHVNDSSIPILIDDCPVQSSWRLDGAGDENPISQP